MVARVGNWTALLIIFCGWRGCNCWAFSCGRRGRNYWILPCGWCRRNYLIFSCGRRGPYANWRCATGCRVPQCAVYHMLCAVLPSAVPNHANTNTSTTTNNNKNTTATAAAAANATATATATATTRANDHNNRQQPQHPRQPPLQQQPQPQLPTGPRACRPTRLQLQLGTLGIPGAPLGSHGAAR